MHYVLPLLLLVFRNVMGYTVVEDACTLPLDTFHVLNDGRVIYHAHTWLSTVKFMWADGSTISDYVGTTEFPTWSISDNSISYGLGVHRRLTDRHKLIKKQRKTMQPGLVERYVQHKRARRLLSTGAPVSGAPDGNTYTGFPTEGEQDGAPITNYCGMMVKLTFTSGTVSNNVVASDVNNEELVLTNPYADLATPCNPNPCAGNCEIHGDSYKCKCPPGRYGERCFETLYMLSDSMLMTYSVGIAVIAALCLTAWLSITNACLPVKTVFKRLTDDGPLRF